MTPSATLKVMQLTFHSTFYTMVLECKARFSQLHLPLTGMEDPPTFLGFNFLFSFLKLTGPSICTYLKNGSEITGLSWIKKYYTKSFFKVVDSKRLAIDIISFPLSRLLGHTISALKPHYLQA